MTRTQIYLDDNQALLAKTIAENEGSNLSELIRKALDSYLATKQSKKNAFAHVNFIKGKKGLFKDLKPWELSKAIDEVVYGK